MPNFWIASLGTTFNLVTGWNLSEYRDDEQAGDKCGAGVQGTRHAARKPG